MRASARVLLLSLGVTAFGPSLHDVHDIDCDPPVVVHDESQHRFDAAPETGRPFEGDHCVACHFHRSSRGAASLEVSGLHVLQASGVASPADGALTASPAGAPRPARAPPALA
jgi:hypothetical protein